MEKIQIEREIFWEVVSRKSYILWVPTLWMIFCLVLVVMLDIHTHNILARPISSELLPFDEFAINFVQKKRMQIVIFSLLTTLALTYRLYTKERDKFY